jgi:hypothetical protein
MMRMMTMKRTPLHPPAHAPAAVPKEIIEEEAPVENGPQELDDSRVRLVNQVVNRNIHS